MAERPLGIIDLYANLPPQPIVGDHWYWCRRHERAEHVDEPIYAVRCPKCDRRIIGKSGPLTQPGEFVGACGHEITVAAGETYTCIRVGPFMSEREANRLGLVVHENHWETDSPVDQPLGMEIEQ